MGPYRPFHKDFAYLFNSYYEAVGPRHPRPRRGLLTRPSVGEIFRYRAHVDAALTERLERLDEAAWSRLRPVVELGCHHEEQHLELALTDIKHAFAQNPLRPAYRDLPASPSDSVPPFNWLPFVAGVRRIGHDGPGFAFDNECPAHRVFVEPFALASRPVTCGEYLAFMNAGGYDQQQWWLSDGWRTRQENSCTAPLYWNRSDQGWTVFTLGGTRPVNESEPVCHVSYYEADAFARWAQARLPTEAEWEVACSSQEITGNLLESGLLHPAARKADDGPVTRAFGDVWEWTQSPYVSYPCYSPPPGALGEYNGKFMCNQLVLRGGSCVTPRAHIRPTYRNFFPADARWQFTGFRLARDLRPE
jgi:ergothioneine biosynthesis protein EgtB